MAIKMLNCGKICKKLFQVRDFFQNGGHQKFKFEKSVEIFQILKVR